MSQEMSRPVEHVHICSPYRFLIIIKVLIHQIEEIGSTNFHGMDQYWNCYQLGIINTLRPWSMLVSLYHSASVSSTVILNPWWFNIKQTRVIKSWISHYPRLELPLAWMAHLTNRLFAAAFDLPLGGFKHVSFEPNLGIIISLTFAKPLFTILTGNQTVLTCEKTTFSYMFIHFPLWNSTISYPCFLAKVVLQEILALLKRCPSARKACNCWEAAGYG